MQQVKKVVLAYSGGVDTSVCIPYLKNEYGISEVVTFVADLGQGEDLELIRQKALNSGASQSIVGDLVKSFVERFLIFTEKIKSFGEDEIFGQIWKIAILGF